MRIGQTGGKKKEIAALAAIQQPTLTVFIGDHRQTPGGLGLRALEKPGDYLPPARMAALVAQLWPVRSL